MGVGPREVVLLGTNLGHAIVTNGDFTAYVCDSAATRPSSQMTLDRLVVVVLVLLLLLLHVTYRILLFSVFVYFSFNVYTSVTGRCWTGSIKLSSWTSVGGYVHLCARLPLCLPNQWRYCNQVIRSVTSKCRLHNITLHYITLQLS